jgi:hypothetical protein
MAGFVRIRVGTLSDFVFRSCVNSSTKMPGLDIGVVLEESYSRSVGCRIHNRVIDDSHAWAPIGWTLVSKRTARM